VSERAQAIGIRLAKAEECLAGAASEYAARRYNNVANRCYYAAFQAAIAALTHAGIQPPTKDGSWGHEFVQAQVAGTLVRRRKLYPSDMGKDLAMLIRLRHVADYSLEHISELQGARAVRRSRSLLAIVAARTGGVR
jgi:uncharacterized protein (UPF0332 family)